MTMRHRSPVGLAAIALTLALGLAAPARAAVLWTLTASPLTVTAGTPTTFTLRASLALLGDIRCIEVGVPDNFIVTAAAVVGSNAGDSWTSRVVGNDVWVHVTSGGDRLRFIGHYVDFTITATALSPGSLAWGSHSHDQEDCGGAESLLSVPPIVLVLGPAITPTPAPTVAPTPAPTSRPTLSPLPSLAPIALPTPRPSVGVGLPPFPIATPASSSPGTPTPGASAPSSPEQPPAGVGSSSPGSTPRASGPAEESPGVVPVPPPPGGGGAGAPVEGRIVADQASPGGAAPGAVPVTLGALGLLASIDLWIVPGLLLGVPGLLVVGFVILQAVGALAWIPAIRRLRGQEAVPAP